MRRLRGSTWNLLGAAVLLAGGTLSWMPVNWALQLTQWGDSLGDWGLPGLIILLGAGWLTVVVLLTAASRARCSGSDAARPEVRPLRWWLMVLIAIGIAAATGFALLWLTSLASEAQDPAKARIDAVRTALTLGASLVGVVVLVLTARKQWLAEHTQNNTEADAAEQRVTDLYTAAAQQLASEQAPVRMAGLYALERLAQNNPGHRQTIVNLFCAYLRMPYTPPKVDTPSSKLGGQESRRGLHRPDRSRRERSPLAMLLSLTPALTATGRQVAATEHQQQELQVRLTAQRLLTQHLRPEPDQRGRAANREFWPDMDLDLADTVLYNWSFNGCAVRRARFSRTHFLQFAWFDRAQFHAEAWFRDAQFRGTAWFEDATFHSEARFERAEFRQRATFDRAQFHDRAAFFDVQLHGQAVFGGTQFHCEPEFDGAQVRLGHDLHAPSTWPAEWTMNEADHGSREGRWGELVSQTTPQPYTAGQG